MATRLVYQGRCVGKLHDLDFDQPFFFGRWEPFNQETDRWLRDEVAKYNDTGEWTVVVTFDDGDTEYFITAIDGDEMNLHGHRIRLACNDW